MENQRVEGGGDGVDERKDKLLIKLLKERRALCDRAAPYAAINPFLARKPFQAA
ncbi:MAG: hypothetical protein ABIK45_00590 [Pseudomonadota bacterium]